MSTNGNPHHSTGGLILQRVIEADCWYKHVGVGPGDEAAVARAQVEATLALAHEQRTANLIALLDVGFTSAKVIGVDYAEVADSIKERLGL